MRVIAIPVKPLDRGKSRLAPLLSRSERVVLSLVMLRDVLQACLAQPGWEVGVISRDPQVLAAARRSGAHPLHEEGHRLLSAVRQAESTLGSAELAVVLADLPLISAGALARALSLGERASVVAAPAASDGGTNVLLRRPPSVIPARFGRSSFARHRSEAYRRGVTFQEAASLELGFDLDRPEDVAALLDRPEPGATRAACAEMGLAERLRVPT